MGNIRETLANNLRLHRGKMTQAEFSEKADISLRYYQEIEKSKSRWPQPDKLEKLAAACGIEVEELFIPADQEPAPMPATIREMTMELSGALTEIVELKERIKELEANSSEEITSVPKEVAEIGALADNKDLFWDATIKAMKSFIKGQEERKAEKAKLGKISS